MQQLERYRGSLLGLAAGDALGAPLEFIVPWSFKPVADMVGGGYFQLAPGSGRTIRQWPFAWRRA